MKRDSRALTVNPSPMVVPAGAVITAHIYSRLPWNAHAYDGFVGTTSTGEPLLAIRSEWPLSWATTVESFSQADLESLHVRRYNSDCLLATGNSAFVDVQRGNDPPDMTALTDMGRMGVESTSLTFQSRRLAHSLFTHLRRGLESSDPARFADWLVTLCTFGSKTSLLTNPSSPTDARTRQPLTCSSRRSPSTNRNDHGSWI